MLLPELLLAYHAALELGRDVQYWQFSGGTRPSWRCWLAVVPTAMSCLFSGRDDREPAQAGTPVFLILRVLN